MDVTVYGPLRSATGEKHLDVAFDGGTVREALETLVATHPRAESHLFADDGAVRASVRVTVDGERADLEDPCGPAAELTVMPAVQGG